MSEIISVLMVLASLSFILEVVIDRIKEIFPFLKVDYVWTIKGIKWEITPIRYITLILGILFMWSINCPVSLFAALGFYVPKVIDIFTCGVILSGGSDFIFSLMNNYKKKQKLAQQNVEETTTSEILLMNDTEDE